MARNIAWNATQAHALIDGMKHLQGATLPILHALQEQFGYIDASAVPVIADALNMSRAEIHGAISFYHDFHTEPATQRTVLLCRAEACQAVGCETLVDHIHHQHGITMDQPSPDGRLTVKTTYCLGNCALGPAAMVDGQLFGRVDEKMLSDLCQSHVRSTVSAQSEATS